MPKSITERKILPREPDRPDNGGDRVREPPRPDVALGARPSAKAQAVVTRGGPREWVRSCERVVGETPHNRGLGSGIGSAEHERLKLWRGPRR